MPEASAVVVPIDAPSINTSTVELASAVPVNSKVLSFVVLSSTPESVEKSVTAGALGVLVSTVTDSAEEASEVFPDKSVEVLVTAYVPSERVVPL